MRGVEFQTVPLDSVVPGERDPSEVILRVIIIL